MDKSYVKTQLRLPVELHEQIVEASEKSRRSMNAELVVRLEQSFAREPRLAAKSTTIKKATPRKTAVAKR